MRILEACLQWKYIAGLNLPETHFNSKLCGFTIELKFHFVGQITGEQECIQLTHLPGNLLCSKTLRPTF